MSNIIKSFKVIKSNEPSSERADIKFDAIYREIIEEAQRKGEEIIKHAEKKAEDIIDSAYMEYEKQVNNAYERAKLVFNENKEKGYEEGLLQGKEEGYKIGYKKGYEEGKNEAKKLISEALDIKNSYIRMRNNALKEAEKDLIELVITIYEKILYKKLEEDEKYIISLIINGLEGLEIKEKLTIIVSKEDYEVVKKYEHYILAKASLIDSIEIKINSDMEKGDCILETSKGNIDVSLRKQLCEIKDLLHTILNNE
ncbi:MAG: hypothetical protein GXZ06_04170 [Tissierellia bacterium]|nr:hypothetical protein [Tissierellia bacterium]